MAYLYHCQYKRYLRSLVNVQNAQGAWPERVGILLRLEDTQGRVGYGEISPITGFGVESVAVAHRFCQSVEGQISRREIFSIPEQLSCTRYAFESAVRMLEEGLVPQSKQWPVADLLPAGLPALHWLELGLAQGRSMFKWKVGVFDFTEECGVLRAMLDMLPPGGRLRLDANGAWDLSLAQRWLLMLEQYEQVDFVEQPLARHLLSDMQHLAANHTTALALDESVSTGRVMAAVNWPGIFVVKPALLGDVAFFEDWVERVSPDLVFSSAFETSIGVENMLSLLNEVGCRRPLGFGVDKYYADDGLSLHNNENEVATGQLSLSDLEAVWQAARAQ